MIPYVDDQPQPRAIHLFAGAGGGLLGGLLLGWRTVCAVEIDRFCRDVLVARQNDGSLEEFPVWDDVRTFDGRPWAGCCDVLCGGFPCQNVSPLGDRTGIRGSKSCLWCEFARIAGEIRPRWVFAENSSDLIKLGLDVVLQDLDALGYDAEWKCLSAAELGAPHVRDRVWVLAKAREPGLQGDAGAPAAAGAEHRGGLGPAAAPEGVRLLADPDAERREEQGRPVPADAAVHTAELQGEDDPERPVRCGWWESEPGVRRVADGVANGVDRLGALGNGQVPHVAALAFRDLYMRFVREGLCCAGT